MLHRLGVGHVHRAGALLLGGLLIRINTLCLIEAFHHVHLIKCFQALSRLIKTNCQRFQITFFAGFTTFGHHFCGSPHSDLNSFQSVFFRINVAYFKIHQIYLKKHYYYTGILARNLKVEVIRI